MADAERALADAVPVDASLKADQAIGRLSRPNCVAVDGPRLAGLDWLGMSDGRERGQTRLGCPASNHFPPCSSSSFIRAILNRHAGVCLSAAPKRFPKKGAL